MSKTKYNTSYNYNGVTYQLNELQQEILDKLKSLPKENLHYLVVQQSYDGPNLSRNQLENVIRQTLNYCQRQYNGSYNPKQDIPFIRCVCLFEIDKELHLTQMNYSVIQKVELGLHFHLFLSSSNLYDVNYELVDKSIKHRLNTVPGKRECIDKYDFVKASKFTEGFLAYHVKQHWKNPSREMFYANF